MKLPLINIPTIYHVGTLNVEDRATQHAHSYEGSWLSASLCPEAWMQIAKLGGKPTWALSKPDALYLDVNSMGVNEDQVMAWAEENGWISDESVYLLGWLDSDEGQWSSTLYLDEEEAKAERQSLLNDGVRAVLSEENSWLLTEKGRARAKQPRTPMRANDFALQFWLEDFVSPRIPQVAGIYWDEDYDPDGLSAPRAAVLPSAFEAMDVSLARYMDEDEDLLEQRAVTRIYRPENFNSPYEFIINCIAADGDEINRMRHSDACRDLDYEQFLEALGEGGKALLDEMFSEYAGTESMGLTLGTDRAVSFHESSYEGVPCLFLRHSAIEYVFQRREMADAPKFKGFYKLKVKEGLA